MIKAQVSLERLSSVTLDVRVMLGRATVTISDVLTYAAGSIVSLDAAPDAPVALLINGVAVAEGDLVVTDGGALGVEITRLIERPEMDGTR